MKLQTIRRLQDFDQIRLRTCLCSVRSFGCRVPTC